MGCISTPPAFQRPNGKLILSAQQDNLVSGAETLVLLNTIPLNYNDGIENVGTHRITPGVKGFYSITAQVCFINIVVNKQYEIFVKKSDVRICWNANQAVVVHPLGVFVSHSCEYFSGVDYIDLWAKSYAGVNTVDVYEAGYYTFLSVQRVR